MFGDYVRSGDYEDYGFGGVTGTSMMDDPAIITEGSGGVSLVSFHRSVSFGFLADHDRARVTFEGGDQFGKNAHEYAYSSKNAFMPEPVLSNALKFQYFDASSEASKYSFTSTDSKEAVELRWNTLLKQIPNASVQFYPNNSNWVVFVLAATGHVEFRVFLTVAPQERKESQPQRIVYLRFESGDWSQFLATYKQLKASIDKEPLPLDGYSLPGPNSTCDDPYGFFDKSQMNRYYVQLMDDLRTSSGSSSDRLRAIQSLYGASSSAEATLELIADGVIAVILNVVTSANSNVGQQHTFNVPVQSVEQSLLKPYALLLLKNVLAVQSIVLKELAQSVAFLKYIEQVCKGAQSPQGSPFTAVVDFVRTLKDDIRETINASPQSYSLESRQWAENIDEQKIAGLKRRPDF